MSWPLIAGLLILWLVLPALILIALRGRSVRRAVADDGSAQGAEEGGRVFVQHGSAE